MKFSPMENVRPSWAALSPHLRMVTVNYSVVILSNIYTNELLGQKSQAYGFPQGWSDAMSMQRRVRWAELSAVGCGVCAGQSRQSRWEARSMGEQGAGNGLVVRMS